MDIAVAEAGVLVAVVFRRPHGSATASLDGSYPYRGDLGSGYYGNRGDRRSPFREPEANKKGKERKAFEK